MSWDCRLSSRAERALGRIPVRDRERVNRALNEMKGDPFQGDTAPLRGEYQGAYRRRVGSWRILFTVKPDIEVVIIHDIRRRTSSTY
jgi:mRNA-degrading endonuclease RelE of RelBE toxin-antitoxin system